MRLQVTQIGCAPANASQTEEREKKIQGNRNDVFIDGRLEAQQHLRMQMQHEGVKVKYGTVLPICAMMT